MNPLSVALIHRDSPRLNGMRMIGAWSYAVTEFEWTHFPVRKHFYVDRGAFRDYFAGHGPPVAYMIGDSTLSDDHYRIRREIGRQCQLLLVDWDRLERFGDLGVPARRMSYCVNDRLMRDHGQNKTIDLGSFQGASVERRDLERALHAWAKGAGVSFEAGVYGGLDYALMMNRCKIVLNLSRNPETRNHRVFDAMACRTCLLTDPLPEVSGEEREAGIHYLEFSDADWLTEIIPHLLDTGHWEDVAGAGYTLVRERHTWAVRAAELRQIIGEELGL